MNLSHTDQTANVTFQLSLLQLAMIPGTSGVQMPEKLKQEVKELEQYVGVLGTAARR